MEWKLLWVLVLVVLLGGGCECEGCLEQEKVALLQLKPFFNHIEDVEKYWVEGKQSRDCCEWERVECNTSTGRVIRLFLNQTYTVTLGDLAYIWNDNFYEEDYSPVIKMGYWYLNTSLFLPFEELRNLYLSGNFIAGCVDNHGFERLSLKLDKLEFLDLTANNFNDSIFATLSELSSLKSLYLGLNQFTGSNPSNGIEKLLKLNKLEFLDLRSNILGNNILSHLHNFTSLKSLHLQNCELKGTIDMSEFNNLMNLKELYLGNNKIVSLGSSFQSLKGQLRLFKLEVLGLSRNLFNNSIFSSLAALSNLKSLHLESNRLEGPIHIKDLNALSNLEVLDMRNNEVNDFVPSQGNETVLRLTNLKVLDLSWNLFNSSILSSLDALSNLKELYLSCDSSNYVASTAETRMSCNLPLQSLNIFPSLKALNLDGFSLKGTNWTILNALSNLEELYLSCDSSNYVTSTGVTHMNCNLPLQSLNIFSSLKTLELYGFSMKGTSWTTLNALSNLEKLYLNCASTDETRIGCNLSLQSLNIFPSLKILDLDGFSFKGTNWTTLNALSHLEELQLFCVSTDKTNMGCKLQSFDLFLSLKTLDLNGFNLKGTNWTIQNQLQNLSTCLEELTLRYSSLPSSFIHDIRTLTSLKQLEIWSCDVNGNLTTRGLLHLKNLEHFGIWETSLENIFLEKIGTIPSLKSLIISGCELNGTLDTQVAGLCEKKNLQDLDISYNNLMGNLPECFSNLTSLESLDLSSNQFSGNVSTLNSLISLERLYLSSNQFSGNISTLETLKSIQTLSISNNYFEIPISLGPLFNLSKLKFIYVDNNNIYVETEMQSSAPTFQLEYISLSFCGDVGSFPKFLYHQHELRYVDLSNLYFKGEQFPIWLLENNTNLQTLFLANNSFLGNFKLPFLPHADLSYLDISRNSFYGNISNEIGTKLPSLSFLNMSKNSFGGSIPISIGDMNHLQILDLSNNKLTGDIPRWMENMSGLTTLDLSNNTLSGGIPRWMGNMLSLEEIVMANNHLEGPIPIEFCQLNLNLKFLDLSVNNISGSLPSCFSPLWISQVHLSRNNLQGPLRNAFSNSTSLVTLDLSNNHLTGNIPNWIGRLSQLSYLLLKNNRFEGGIPVELCKLDHLSLIDLSNNNLSGTIPPCLKITTLNHKSQVYVNYNYSNVFFIEVPIEFIIKTISYSYKGRPLAYLYGIDLSCNNLIGEIPLNVKNLQNIIVLNLSHNSLTGSIPPAISDLKQIESLDLSYNNLSGTIPSQLVGLYSLSFFSVVCNNLSGRTPDRIAQFATFEESSYWGNPFLCGAPLPKNCSTSEPTLLPTSKASTNNGPIDMEVFYVSFVVSYVMVILVIASVLYINPYWRRAWFHHIEAGISSSYYFLEDYILPK